MQFISRPMLRPGKIERREYQEVLADSVIQRGNTLIVAPTAIGKTVIAAIVAAHVLEKGKKILFLAPTKPLAVQHLRSMREFIDLPETEFCVLTGAVPPEERREMYGAKIITGTPQALENDLLAGVFPLSDFGLVVFDEAHRAAKGYSYVFIADQYARKVRGLILALTASPGSSVEKIQEVCQNLFIKNIEVRTEQDLDVAPYLKKKTIEWKKVKFPGEFAEVKELFQRYIHDRFEELKNLGYVDSYKTATVTRRELLELQKKLLEIKSQDVKAYQALSIVAALMKIHHAELLLETQGIRPLLAFFETLKKSRSKASKNILADLRIQKALVRAEKLKSVEHPKMAALVETVKKELENADRVIVFSHYRETAAALRDLLRAEGISCERFVGQASRDFDRGLSQKKQIELLKRFADGEFRVIIATSVAEEGLDLPAVDSVIFYEPVPSEIRLIQRRGRTARKRPGRIVVLMTEGTRDETYYWISVSKEKRMRRVLGEMKAADAGQKTLEAFTEPANRAVVYVDLRERASGIVREILKNEVDVKPMQLPVGDFLVSERICVERKTGEDFIQSMIDGRLFGQAKELVDNFSNPIIVLEGPVFGIRNVHDNAIRGATAALAVDYGISVIQTADTEDSAAFIAFLAKREQLGEERPVRLRGDKRVMGMAEQQQYIVESLPGIGPALAKTLLSHFGSVEKVFTASEKELMQVDGVGEKRAGDVRKIINMRWGRETA